MEIIDTGVTVTLNENEWIDESNDRYREFDVIHKDLNGDICMSSSDGIPYYTHAIVLKDEFGVTRKSEPFLFSGKTRIWQSQQLCTFPFRVKQFHIDVVGYAEERTDSYHHVTIWYKFFAKNRADVDKALEYYGDY